jgi:hypothetical protein
MINVNGKPDKGVQTLRPVLLPVLIFLRQFDQAAFAELVDLDASREPGELFQEAKFIRKLVGCDFSLQKISQFFQRNRSPPLRDDARANAFSEDWVGGSDNAHVLDCGVIHDQTFELVGVDLVAAAIDQVFCAAINFEVIPLFS